MADKPTDEELMAAYIEKGSETAFSELYRRYDARIYGFFVRRLTLSTRERALDLFQKTWLKVHVSRHQFETNRKFSSWIFSIALNTLRDELRRRDFGEEVASTEELENIVDGEDVEERFSQKEKASRLEQALSQLSGSDREAMLLGEWEGFNADELSNLWNVSATAARQRVSRARKRVRMILGKESSIPRRPS